mgnify:CR=1 FL=1
MYAWTIPDAIGTTLRVRISDASDGTVLDTSNANFKIMGGFTLTAPNGGEVWTVAEFIATLPAGILPEHVGPDWDLSRLYVSNYFSTELTVIDPSGKKVSFEELRR